MTPEQQTEILEFLRSRADEWQNKAESFSGDPDFDEGVVSGMFRCGDEVETLLRRLGLCRR